MNYGPKKSHSTSQYQKKSRKLSGQKISRKLFVQQKIMQQLGGKNVLKIQILATIKLQEIGTDHHGLVLLDKLNYYGIKNIENYWFKLIF